MAVPELKERSVLVMPLDTIMLCTLIWARGYGPTVATLNTKD